jgi:hypothetical protein
MMHQRALGAPWGLPGTPPTVRANEVRPSPEAISDKSPQENILVRLRHQALRFSLGAGLILVTAAVGGLSAAAQTSPVGSLKNSGWSDTPGAVQATKQWRASTRIGGVLRLLQGAQVGTSPPRAAIGEREVPRPAASG